MTPRSYGDGSLYQRASDGRWVGTLEAGWSAKGTRRRITVTGKTRAEAQRKLRDKRAQIAREGLPTSGRMTVKGWVEEYAEMRLRDLRPKAYNAAINPLRKWVVPTIGHKRLDMLTPADVRAVETAQRKAGRQAGDTHRTLMTMLRAAVREGHQVPPRVLEVKAPVANHSDRQAMTLDEGIECLAVAAEIPNGSRWLFTLLYGQRMGECLGLTWESVDFTERDGAPFGEARIEWQLQPLPYRVARDRSSGFRVPDGYEARHLVDAYHLVRPKSRAGYRVAPLLEPVRDSLLAWRDRAPESPHGLVWPVADGRPCSDKVDRAEWHALQDAAGVAHPAGRPYHVHECRNFAATSLFEAGVDEGVITALLGHSAILQSRKYLTVRRAPLLDALTKMGERLQLG